MASKTDRDEKSAPTTREGAPDEAHAAPSFAPAAEDFTADTLRMPEGALPAGLHDRHPEALHLPPPPVKTDGPSSGATSTEDAVPPEPVTSSLDGVVSGASPTAAQERDRDHVPTLVDLSPPGAVPASVSLPDAEADPDTVQTPVLDDVTSTAASAESDATQRQAVADGDTRSDDDGVADLPTEPPDTDENDENDENDEKASANPAAPTSPGGRTAFDALNPYGDFGGSDPTTGRLLVVAALLFVAVFGAAVVLALWANDALEARQARLAEEDAKRAPVAAPAAPAAQAEEIPAATEETEEATAPARAEEPAAHHEEETRAGAQEEAREEQQRARSDDPASENNEPPARAVRRARPPPPPPPPPALVLLGSRDRTDADTRGLDDALQSGFLVRLAVLAPDAVVKRTGRATGGDVSVKLVLQRLHDAAGAGVHDVTVRCAAGMRPRSAVPGGSVSAQARSQGPELTVSLRQDAARQCGVLLAEALAPVARSLK